MQIIWFFLISLLFLTSFLTNTEMRKDDTSAHSSLAEFNEIDETSAPRIQPRIYGGEEIKNGILGGFAVQVFRKDNLVCTGTLLSPRHFITAAHCFENSMQKDFHAVAGRSDEVVSRTLTRKNRLIQVRQHPQFRKTDFIADIAVAKVQYPMKSKYIGYALICSSQIFPHEFVTVAGWGKNGGPSSATNSLRTIKVPIMAKKECERRIGRAMPPNIICAGAFKKRTICDGDSGGPLMFRNEVCGVSTWTWECGQSKKPDVYMSVRYYADFIKNTMALMGN